MAQVTNKSKVKADGASSPNRPERILSVDVLRGFDMFWLCGGTGFALALAKLFGGPLKEPLMKQFDHPEWFGFTFYDLIFPLFVFIVGMSVVFSLGSRLKQGGARAAYPRLIRRFILLFLLGVLYYGGMKNAWSDIRWLGVLQRLALCYLFTGILFCHLGPRSLAAVCAGILIGYWALLCFIPLPGAKAISWAVAENWACYLDNLLLPGRKYDGTWDPEGLLSTLPAVSTCLLGVFAALLLRNENVSPSRKLLWFIVGGLAMAAIGGLWGYQFPVIKKIWTSSYVLVTGGLSFALLGLFYLIVDIWKIQWWTAPFVWIGANPITIYLLRNVMNFNELADRFVGGSIAASVSEDTAYLLRMAVSLALSLLLLRFLYKRGIFLRV